MKIVALDIGDITTGLAIADQEGIFISTRPDLKTEVLLQGLEKLAKEEYVRTVIYGLPLNSAGEQAFQCQKVNTQIATLKQALLSKNIEMNFIGIDERRSSIGARHIRSTVGGKTKGSEHAIAAALLLEIYFQRLRADSE